jgi:hypothetical protein
MHDKIFDEPNYLGLSDVCGMLLQYFAIFPAVLFDLSPVYTTLNFWYHTTFLVLGLSK